MTALLITVAFFTLAGAAIVTLSRLRLPPTHLGQLAYAFLAGVAAVGLVLHILLMTGIPIVRSTLLAIAGVAIVSILWRRVRFDRASLVHSRVATALLAIPILTILAAAIVLPIRDYDGRVTWLPKARAIAHAGGVAAPYFAGSGGLNLHNTYPMLLPLDAASLMILTGDDSDTAARFLYACIAIATLLVLRDFLGVLFPQSAAWVVAAVAWLPAFVRIEGGALAAYNDIALMSFATIVIAQLMLHDPDVHSISLFLAAMLLTKNEGVAIAFAILLVTVVLRRRALPGKWLTLIIPVIAAAGMLAWWRSRVPPAYDERYDLLISDLPNLAHRLPSALAAIAKHAMTTGVWGFFWPAVLVALIAVALRRDRALIAVPATVMLLVLGAYVTALTVTSWDITELANVAADRLLMHILGPACMIVAAAVEPRLLPLQSSTDREIV